jgi:hypothetical protein
MQLCDELNKMTLLEILEMAKNAEPGNEIVAPEDRLYELGFDGNISDFASLLIDLQDWKADTAYKLALDMIEKGQVVKLPVSKWIIFNDIFMHKVKMIKCTRTRYTCQRGFSYARNECYTYEEALAIVTKRIDARIKALEELKCSYMTN